MPRRRTLTGRVERKRYKEREILRRERLKKISSFNGGTDNDTFGDFRVKNEPTEAIEIKAEIETCIPSCSSFAKPIVVPVLLTKAASIPEIIIKSEPVEPEPENGAINTNDEAIRCVMLLEEFALLKEDFRLIGVIERLEQAFKQDKQ